MFDKKAAAHAYYLANKESITKRTTAYRKAFPASSRKASLLKQWRINGVLNNEGNQFTHIDYDRQYQVQQGRCAGCSIHQTELPQRLFVDHDHITGKVRGLLCRNCNTALGQVQDRSEILIKLAAYLNNHKEQI